MNVVYLFFSCCWLCFICLLVVTAEILTIPARSAGGSCSPSPVDYISFEGRVIDTRGVAGIYVMPKEEYEALASASNSQSSRPVNFKYYNEISCVGSPANPVSSCARSSALNGNETICVVFINQQSTSTQVNLAVVYKLVGKTVNTNNSAASSSDESLSVTSITIISVAGFLGLIVIIVLSITVCRRIRDRRRAKFDAVFERPGPIPVPSRPRFDQGYAVDAATEISYGAPLLLSNGPAQDSRPAAPYMMYPPHFMPPHPPTSYESYSYHPNAPNTPPLPMTSGSINPYNPYMVSYHAPVANSGQQHFQQ